MSAAKNDEMLAMTTFYLSSFFPYIVPTFTQ